MFFSLQSNLPTTPFTAIHHTSRPALMVMISLLLVACGGGNNTPTPTPSPLAAPDLSMARDQKYTQNTHITALVLPNTGGDVTASTGCAVGISDSNSLPTGLSVEVVTDNGKRTCQIIGTPMEVVSPARTVIITATNTAGSDSATFSITVNPIAPTLQAPGSAQSYPTGAPVNVELVNNGGGELRECTGNNTLPSGLMVITNAGNDSCVITGTPDTITAAADFEITATNVTGSSLPVTVSIAVVSGVASIATPDPLVYEVGEIVNESFTNTNAVGSRVSDCVSTDTLPDGLSINAIISPGNGCVLTGTPITITAQASYTITVRNNNGDASLVLDITVNPVAPNLQALRGAQSYPTGAPVNVELTNNGGGELRECTVNNTLPSGLMVTTNTGNDSCVITGTPDTVTAAADFEITATNVTGSSLPVTVSIAVVSGVASIATPDPLVYEVGEIVNEIFTNTNTSGSRVSDCVSTDTLPDGLSINAIISPGNGCVLTGTPTTITAQASYTITVRNNNGDASLVLDITVNPVAPNLQAPGSAQSYPTGAPVNVELTNDGGGKLRECTVNNTLPSGLMVTTNAGNDSCVITGTPDTVTAAADFEITATNVTGSSLPVTVSIAVVSGIASIATPDPLVYEVGEIVNEIFTNTNTSGSRVSDCVPTDTLPDGLSINAIISPGNGCVLTGTPITITAQASYTITVRNNNGDASLTLGITVNPVAPNLQAPGSAQSYPTGAPVNVELTNNGGGELRECTGNNTLPSGLMVTTNTGNDSCVITGTPDTVTAAADFEITATNVTGSSLPVTVSIAVVSGIASIATPDPLVYEVGEIVNEIFTNTNTSGSRVSDCVPTDTLPDGLSINAIISPGNGCVLTGTPITITAQASYTITVRNNNGDASLTLGITVNRATPRLQAPGSAQSYPTGAPVNVELVNTGGGELRECTVNNTLPSGLMVTTNAGNDSCVITGTPDTITAAADFEITATNVTGSSLPVTVSIAVVSGIASIATPDPLVYEVGEIVNEIFTNTNTSGSRVSDCVSTDTLPDGLSINVIISPGNGCVLTGTPITITAQASYTITVRNNNGDASLTLGITVNRATPRLQAPGSAQSYPTGAPVNVELTNNGGGELRECTVNNTLPSGLMVTTNTGNDSCVITGTPDTVTAAADFEITATNVTGSSLPVTVSIAVVSGIASIATPDPLVYEVGEIVNEIFTNTNAVGSRVSDCVSTDTLPDGLSIGAIISSGNGCVLTGTPITITAQASYTITVRNNNGDASLTLDITVNPVAPKLTSVNAQIYAPGTDITPLVFDNTGGDVTDGITGCTVDRSGGKPNLPTGLSVGVVTDNGKRTCQITGMPTEVVSTARTVTITATNITGSDTVTVPIIVSSGIVPGSLSGQSLFRYEAGRTDTRQITFTNFGGDAITSCTVPDMIDGMPNGLPDGMSIDFDDCAISGEPLRIMAQTTPHTITAMHMSGATSTATISIETYLSAPPSLSNYSSVTLVVGSTVGLPIVLENTGGLVGENGCQVTSDNAEGTRPLRTFGLELAVTDGNSSCEIKVINTPPTTTVERTGYRISATNDLGVSGAVATLTIIDADGDLLAPTLTAPASSFTFATNTAIDPINFDLDDGGVIGICTIDQTLPDDQTLPAGLRLNPSTCQITGTPMEAVSPARMVTITATNATGSASADISITVTNAAPSLERMIDLGLTMNSNVGLPFAIANTGGSPTDCAADPTTAGDDDLDSYNLIIFVADGTCVIDSRDGNGPSRTLDGGSFTITASGTSTNATATLTLNLRTPATPQISVGNTRTYAINSARQLFGWGSNFENRLGLGDLDEFLPSTSTPILLTGNDWAQVASGSNHTCAIKTSGQLFCWGANFRGQLGLGNNTDTDTPTQVGDAIDWAQVDAGFRYTCAINTSGQLFCWGDGEFGRLGLGGTVFRPDTPMKVDDAMNWMQVSTGSNHTCAINTSGRLFCWGFNREGQLGLGDNTNTNTPMGVDDAIDWMQVSAGFSYTCAIKTSGQLFCWGEGNFGRLGLGNNDDKSIPTQVTGANVWVQISAGISHTCAINASRELWCWGRGENGRLGLGDNTDTDTPGRVGGDDGSSDWMQVTTGLSHTCAIKTSGQLWCWGLGEDGRLGLGSDTSMNTPAPVPDFLLQ